MTPFRIFIVDGHPTAREGLAFWISSHSDLILVGEAESAAAAYGPIAATNPHLVIVEATLLKGNHLVEKVRDASPQSRFLFWSNDGVYHPPLAHHAGVSGYISKTQVSGQVIAAIRGVIDGKATSCTLSEEPGAQALSRLSGREMLVFQHIAEGLNTIEIAEVMKISRKTVETFIARIKVKLDLANGSELVRSAVAWDLTGNPFAGRRALPKPGASLHSGPTTPQPS